MSVSNSGSVTPKSLRFTKSSHSSHWLDTPEEASSENSTDTARRTSRVRPVIMAWKRPSISSSGPGGRTLGASRSTISRLIQIRMKNAIAKMKNRAILASSTRPHTSVRPSESNHR